MNVYVDNFLGIPTGGLVPSAYYDREISAWVPQANGVVIKIVGSADGTAELDIDGDEAPENASRLASAAITAAELKHLAASYPVGKSLWRMPVAHFTAMDFNCPENPGDRNKPNTPGDRPNGTDDDAGGGGEVNLSSQIFTETIPVIGAPMALHYSSARVPGYRVQAGIRLPITGAVLGGRSLSDPRRSQCRWPIHSIRLSARAESGG